MTELQGNWNSISITLLKDPHDVRLWQSLVHSAESQNGLINKTSNHVEVQNLRTSYESFLERFPFYLKYWMAYALWERRLNNNDRAEIVFSRALQFGQHDVTLWVAYLKFKIETLTNNIGDVLQLFEAARLKIGYHYHSFEFYQLYQKFLNTYADNTNSFRKKSILLLRVMLEIPLYNYSASYDQIISFLSSPSTTIEDLSSFMHETALKALKKSSQNNKRLIQADLEKIIADAYIVNQAKSYQLFNYEILVTSNSSSCGAASISVDQLETWDNYLNAIESTYPFDYVAQLFERSLLSTGNNSKIVIKYFNFCFASRKFTKARNVLRKTMSTLERNASIQLLLCLTDLEIATGSVLLAKDMISRYISVNNNVPDSIFEKLLQIEALISSNDEEYLCNLVHEIMVVTNSPAFFEKISKFPISRTNLKNFFLQYVCKTPEERHGKLAASMDLKSRGFFWKILKNITSETDLEGISVPQEYR
ncbi:hypothetical protein JCM33374_g5384 [Metschnikowia sp. JCM 33374]|nr:hypothetical protein JCM33374_g5384 [Metschnikowia sp. JCM 33374]